MADVFISYCSKDMEQAQKLTAEMDYYMVSYWMDTKDLPKGAKYDDWIPNAIAECKVMVILISENSMKSEDVKNELRLAISSGKKIIPFMLEDIGLKDAFHYHIEANSRILAYKNWDLAVEHTIDAVKNPFSINKTPLQETLDVSEGETSAFPEIPILRKAVNEFSKKSLESMCNQVYEDIKADYSFFEGHIRNAMYNDPDSQFILAKKYYYGQGLGKNVDKAVYWLTRAVNHQNSEAWYLLGKCFESGTGVKRDPAISAHCYELSASQQDPCSDAVFKTAECYVKRQGVSPDPLKSAFWYRKAMEIELKKGRQIQGTADVTYAYQYMQLLKSSPPAIAVKLKNAGYSMADLSEEQIALIEQLHKEKKRKDTFDSISGFALIYFLMLLIFEFALGFMQQDALSLPYCAITSVSIVVIAGLCTPSFIMSGRKKTKIGILLKSILIAVLIAAVVIVCAFVIYWAGRWLGLHIISILLLLLIGGGLLIMLCLLMDRYY